MRIKPLVQTEQAVPAFVTIAGLMKHLLLLTVAVSSLAFSETKVFSGFTLIDGTGGTPVSNAAMIVTNGKISWIGTKANLKSPTGAEAVDLTGKFVMPGIINLHGHLGMTKGLVQDAKNFTRENLQANLATYAAYGVTSVLSMGSDQPLVFDVRAEQRTGRPTVARIFTAGRGFTGKEGYPTKAAGMKGVPYEITEERQATQFVSEQAAKGVDIIKIWVDDHLGKEPKIQLNLSKAIIEAAQKRGLRVAAHIFYLKDAKDLVGAGLSGLAHSVRDQDVDQELIDLMKKKNAWQMAATFTRELSVFAYTKDAPFLHDAFFTKGVTPAVLATLASKEFQGKQDHEAELYRGFLKTAQRNLKKLADAGVKWGFGTDTGPPGRFPGFFEHLEMELMAEAGFTPMQIISAFSKQNAEYLGVEKTQGTLTSGKWADMVVLTKNPLLDIRNSRTIDSVWIGGGRVAMMR